MARSADDPRKMLGQLARGYLRFAAENPNLYRLMFSADTIAYRVHPELELASDSSFGRLVEWWYGAGSFDPQKSAVEYPYALSTWSLMHGASMQMIDGHVSVNMRSKAAIHRLADTVVGVLIDGLDKALPKKT
jgi:hypothetical protein